MRLRSLTLFFIGIPMLLHGCGSDTPEVTRSPDQPGSSATVSDKDIMAEGQFHTVRSVKEKYEVTYHDDTVIVSETAMRYMAPIYDDPERLEFSIDAKPHLQLERGKVTIFPLAALRRVVSWQESADKILVNTEPAILTDAIKDADIESITEILWATQGQGVVRNSLAEQIGPMTFRIFPEAHASDEVGSWENEIGYSLEHKGLKIEFKIIPESWDKLGFEIKASASKKANLETFDAEEIAATFPNRRVNADNAHADYYHHDEFMPVESDGGEGSPTGRDGALEEFSVSLTGGVLGVAKATGFVSGFTQNVTIRIGDSILDEFYFDLQSLRGELKLESASLEGLMGTFYLKIPLEISIPIRIGLIPTTLKLGAELSFRPIVKTNSSGSTQLCFKAKYAGSTGFKYANGGFSNESVVTEKTSGPCEESDTVSAGKVTVGLGATVKFPSVSLDIFHETVVPELYVELNGRTVYEPGIANAQPACQSGDEKIALIFKAVLKFLGAEFETHSKLWETEKEWNCEKQLVVTSFDKAGGEQKTVIERPD